jgi:monoamine oxidase
MKAHIVGGGFGGLAAAALLIRNAGVSGADITIYEADERLGGGFFLGGSAESGYNLPGSVFDKEFRCTFDLLNRSPPHATPPFPSRRISSPSIWASRTMTGRTSSIATAGSCMVRVSASAWATASDLRGSC